MLRASSDPESEAHSVASPHSGTKIKHIDNKRKPGRGRSEMTVMAPPLLPVTVLLFNIDEIGVIVLEPENVSRQIKFPKEIKGPWSAFKKSLLS